MANSPSKAEIDAYARGHGFPGSDYPYAERVNTCGSTDLSSLVLDGWFLVSFENACRNHDRCYITLGSNREECDRRFLKDLLSACKQYIMRPWKQEPYVPKASDIAIYNASSLIVGPWINIPPTPALPCPIPSPVPPRLQPQAVESLLRAKKVAHIYYQAVRASGSEYFNKSQELARRYTAFTEDYIAGRFWATTPLASTYLLLSN